MNLVKITFILILFSSHVLTAQNQDVFNKFDQLIGVWVSEYPGYKLYEKWERISSTKFEGAGYKVVGRDTILIEIIDLIFNDDSIYYSPQVIDQNDGRVISFKMSEEEKQFRFVNLLHDFPKEIIYDFITNDEMIVKLKGSEKKSKEVTFYFKKLNN
jgi:hypothetical protein